MFNLISRTAPQAPHAAPRSVEGCNARRGAAGRASLVSAPVAVNIDQFYIDRPAFRGNSPQTQQQREELTAHHVKEQATESCPKKRELREAEFLTSRLADREMAVGDQIPLLNGVFEVSETFVSDGAYVACLEDTRGQLPPKLVCRGTAMRRTATQSWQSGLNNLLPEIGSRGVGAVWQPIQSHLKRIGATSVEVLGKSMGGACAQQLACALEEFAGIQVVKLITNGSVGVGPLTHSQFKEKVLQHRPEPFKILVIRNGGRADGSGADYIPFIGGEHLGYNTLSTQCAVEVCYIGPGAEIFPPQTGRLWRMAQRFFASFSQAHIRQTTLKPFNVASYTERLSVDAHLQMGTTLEAIRRSLAEWLAWSGLIAPAPRLAQTVADTGAVLHGGDAATDA